MRKLVVTLSLLVLCGALSLQAFQGKRKGPPWQETVATREFRHLHGALTDQVIYQPAEAGMYRVTVYASSEQPETFGPFTARLSYFDEYDMRSRELFNEAPTGTATQTIWSMANPITVSVNASSSAAYSVYVTVEKF